MHDDELWQLFGSNGEPIHGSGVHESSVSENKGVGIAQLWLYRRSNEQLEVLLQVRSMAKKRYPGRYSSSAGGHVNLGESYISALVREAAEEIGVAVDPERVMFLAEIKTDLEPDSFRRMYLYEAEPDISFRFDDGEVEKVEWVTLDRFKQMNHNPDAYNLVDQGKIYQDTVIHAFEQL